MKEWLLLDEIHYVSMAKHHNNQPLIYMSFNNERNYCVCTSYFRVFLSNCSTTKPQNIWPQRLLSL